MDVWKQSSRLAVTVYQQLAELKDYGFKDQITRSSLSIPSNIAEGFGRGSNKEKRNFINYARGSCSEFRTQTYIGIEIGYIPKKTGSAWIKESEKITGMLTNLMKYLEKNVNG